MWKREAEQDGVKLVAMLHLSGPTPLAPLNIRVLMTIDAERIVYYILLETVSFHRLTN